MTDTLWPRRTFLKTAAFTSAAAALPLTQIAGAGSAVAGEELDTSTVLEENGYLTQDWFLDSFLELSDDLEETTGENKRLAIIWEQKGCPYCRETHMVNFSTPTIRDWIREHFNIIQMDIWGSREVTDFDGEVLEERELAQKSRVTFTPTIQFFPSTLEEIAGRSGMDAEAARMPGYFKRFHFLTMFEFIYDNSYKTENFQRYLMAKGDRLRENGQEVDLW